MKYRMSTRRKLMIATWDAPAEGNIYGKISLDMTQALQYLAYLKTEKQQKITITHLIGKIAGNAMARTPSINGRIVFGKYIPFDTTDLSFLVVLNEGEDLAKVKVRNIDKKSLLEISQELSKQAQDVRAGKDDQFEKSKPLLRLFPTWLIRRILWFTGFLTGSLGIGVRALGLEPFPFGSCIVTSVGMMGVDEGYAPATPFARVPVYVVVTALKDEAVVIDGKIVVRPMLNLMATIDHRFLDGYQGGELIRYFREAISKPWTLDGLSEAPWAVTSPAHLSLEVV